MTKLKALAKSVVQTSLKQGASDAAVSVGRKRFIELKQRDGKLERVRESSSSSLTLSVYAEGRYSQHSTSDLRPDALAKFVEQAIAVTRFLEPDEYRRLLDKAIVPYFGGQHISQISRADVTRFHNRLSDTPRRANFALSVLSKLMSCCEIEGHREINSNPCRLIKKYRETSRQRFLSDVEIDTLGQVLSDLEARGEESAFV
ncbi:MAG: DNA gyrase modulator, partial [Myxococcota bacterium]